MNCRKNALDAIRKRPFRVCGLFPLADCRTRAIFAGRTLWMQFERGSSAYAVFSRWLDSAGERAGTCWNILDALLDSGCASKMTPAPGKELSAT